LDRLAEHVLPGRRLALLSHHAAVDACFRSAASVFRESPDYDLVALLGPQHGFWGETQDNMIEWESHPHPDWGIPVYSLYGASREPSPGMLEGIDFLAIDIQDVGSRYYTYIYAMALSMRAASAAGIPVVVLDRHNPLGIRRVEGRPQMDGFLSYVGMYPLPVRHAMTPGELARHFAGVDGLPQPFVVPVDDPGLDGFPHGSPWVLPSPNMPTPETALVYPGMCLLEGTNLSEGRGTTRPFEIFGAPWLDPEALCGRLAGSPAIAGALLRPFRFVPSFNKHAGTLCGGAQIHVTDPGLFRPYLAGLAILAECFRAPETRWKDPPYEYVWDRMPIDILTGDPCVRAAIEGCDLPALESFSNCDPGAWMASVARSLVYEREFTT
jgi:uncharacterized protein YbbC (DUF1343 family)